MIGSCRAAPQESWKIHKGVKTGQNKGAVVSGVRTSPQDRRGESVFFIHRARKRKLDPMHLPKTCWTQCVSSAVPLTRYENRECSVSISRPLPEAAHHKGSAFMSSSLRVLGFFLLLLLLPLTLAHGTKEFQPPYLRRALRGRCTPCVRQPAGGGFEEADSISCPAALTFGERRRGLLMWAAEWSRVCFYGPAARAKLPLSLSHSRCPSLCPPLTMPARPSLSSVSFIIHLFPPTSTSRPDSHHFFSFSVFCG